METASGKLVSEYLKKYPDMLTQTLAKLIYRENPEEFKSVDSVRSMIRYRRGSMGEKNKGKADRNELLQPRKEESIREYMQRYYTLPEEPKPVREIVFPTALNKTLLLSDIHIPDHDLQAILCALEYGESKGMDSIILNGDTMDQYHVSSFTKDPRKKSISYEMDLTREFLEFLKSSFPNVQIYFKVGNHDERYERYFMTKAPELFGDEYYSLNERLGLIELGIHYVASKQWIKYGHLNIMHGHEFGNSVFSPVNPARGIFMRAKCSTIVGHYHQTSSHHENNLNGKEMACFSTGCLSTLSPEYRPTAETKWNHGAAFLEKDSGGDFHVDNFRIIDGKIR